MVATFSHAAPEVSSDGNTSRAHLKFFRLQLPLERVMGSIMVSLLVIQDGPIEA